MSQQPERRSCSHHAAFFFNAEEQQESFIKYFIRGGLERHEQVICHLSDYAPETILARLCASNLKIRSYVVTGQLKFIDAKELSPHDFARTLDRRTAEARAQGYSSLRVTTEISPPNCEDPLEYEGSLERYLHAAACWVVCQYDRRRFDAGLLWRISEKHPLLTLGNGIWSNPSYATFKE